MKTLIAALVLVSVQAQASLVTIAKCQSTQRGFDIGTSVVLNYDSEAQKHKLIISRKSIRGTHTVVEDAVALPHPMVPGAPEAYVSVNYRLVIRPIAVRFPGSLTFQDSDVSTPLVCVRLR